MRIFRILADVVVSLSSLVASPFFLLFGRYGPRRLPWSRELFRLLGFFPIRNHFYSPSFARVTNTSGQEERRLPGLDLNVAGQTQLLKNCDFSEELLSLQLTEPRQENLFFDIENNEFKSGDSEFLYSFVRATKPSKVIEIGAGNSSKLIELALRKNRSEDPSSKPTHIAIDPYAPRYLKQLEISVMEEKVEQVDVQIFQQLNEGDLLFIDSTHMIQPDGDVLKEYLEVIPALKSGVNVHVHDIFTPYDYPSEWRNRDVSFWNEQYLLEALLTDSSRYQILASLFLLSQQNYEELNKVCPYLTPQRNPGSFYFRVV